MGNAYYLSTQLCIKDYATGTMTFWGQSLWDSGLIARNFTNTNHEVNMITISFYYSNSNDTLWIILYSTGNRGSPFWMNYWVMTAMA